MTDEELPPGSKPNQLKNRLSRSKINGPAFPPGRILVR